ncbi:hypothetical protein [Aneurinibacillus uraniidurans]|uniref:hypothetical protein n=1 Tax=Aneurinibacillus uraniidurans TaxID=2966586 RepID=UPI00234B41E4|nr:hypothetical protein [Aneurinibacillus sp. B1]WCN37365.1 hypothetical protein PO771_16390 [Aneurinibacillus sp. B1]
MIMNISHFVIAKEIDKNKEERQKCSKYEHHGWNEGYDIGLTSGKMIEKNETIRRLLHAGFTDKDIMKYADVSAKELENMKRVLEETNGKLPEDPDYSRWLEKHWWKWKYGIDVEVRWPRTAREVKLERVIMSNLSSAIQGAIQEYYGEPKPFECPQLIELEPLPEYGTKDGTFKFKLKVRVRVKQDEVMMWFDNVHSNYYKLLSIQTRHLKEQEPLPCD